MKSDEDGEGLSSLVTGSRSYSNFASVAGYARWSSYGKFYLFLADYVQYCGMLGRDECIFVHFS